MKPDLLDEVTGDLYRHQRGWSNGDVWETVAWLPERPAWMARGACAGLDPELFHPEKGDRWTLGTAKAVCAGCPVVDDCREYGLTARVGERYVQGVWGGLSDQQRKLLRAERRRGAA